MNEKKNDMLERFEKASTVVRNMIVIIGAVLTVILFAIEKLDDPVVVTVDELYVSGENIFIMGRQATALAKKDVKEATDKKNKIKSKDESHEIKGKLGEVTRVFIRNTGKQPVKLEVKIPAVDEIFRVPPEESEKNAGLSHFTLIDAEPSCAIRKSEIDITNGGVLAEKEIGSISIPALPPDCSLRVSIAHTGSTGFLRYRPAVEVFYDGKRARIKDGVSLYGPIGQYVKKIEDRGVFGIFYFIILPLLIILISVLLVSEQIAKNRKKSGPSELPAPDCSTASIGSKGNTPPDGQ